MRLTIFITSIIVVMLLISGCSNNSDMMNDPQNQEFVQTLPKDGQTLVRLDQVLELNFYKPVDKNVVENGFYLISTKDMVDSICQTGINMMHGDMHTAMMDTMKMNHLAMQHRTSGKFTWLSDSQCLFNPDSLLLSNMEYMMYMDQGMMNMMQERMGMEGMPHMGMMESGIMIVHFITLDPSVSTGGHDDHH